MRQLTGPSADSVSAKGLRKGKNWSSNLEMQAHKPREHFTEPRGIETRQICPPESQVDQLQTVMLDKWIRFSKP